MNFTEQLNEVGIVLNDTQRSQFDKYFEILVEWNGFMNLTGITEYEEVLVKHFLDSWDLRVLRRYMRAQRKVQEMQLTGSSLTLVCRGLWLTYRHLWNTACRL